MNHWNPNAGIALPGQVDWVEEHVVTEEMVDRAIRNGPRPLTRTTGDKEAALDYIKAVRRERARRNIAIGIVCGSYMDDD